MGEGHEKKKMLQHQHFSWWEGDKRRTVCICVWQTGCVCACPTPRQNGHHGESVSLNTEMKFVKSLVWLNMANVKAFDVLFKERKDRARSAIEIKGTTFCRAPERVFDKLQEWHGLKVRYKQLQFLSTSNRFHFSSFIENPRSANKYLKNKMSGVIPYSSHLGWDATLVSSVHVIKVFYNYFLDNKCTNNEIINRASLRNI